MAPQPSRKQRPRSRPAGDDEDDGEIRSPRKSQSRQRGQSNAKRKSTQESPKRRSGTGAATTPEKRRSRPPAAYHEEKREQRRVVDSSDSPSNRGSNTLSIDSIAKLNASNEKAAQLSAKERQRQRERKEKAVTGRVIKERAKHKRRIAEEEDILYEKHRRKKSRNVSGAILEEGRARRQRGGYISEKDQDAKRKKKKKFCIIGAALVIALVIAIAVGVSVSKNNSSGGTASGADGDSNDPPNNANLGDISSTSIPTSAKGSYFDPFGWYDTIDYNLTYTTDTVGGLPIMGLNSSWDDSKQANQYVPPLNKPFNYGQMPIRGINVGGWLSLEPFITPSLFSYSANERIIDEYSLTKSLGPASAAKTLEKHYSSFITKQSFSEIRDAGFDHVRIPFSYWAVATYPGDPYVPRISWRYLLRGIEYCRQNGLRVKLDLHGAPGSQNGWNHSGRQGDIGWLNGTDGTTNGQRTIDVHKSLAAFFSQARYKNVVTLYGLVNEPKMISLSTDSVLDWTTQAVSEIRAAGMTMPIVIGDGFLGLPKWQGRLSNVPNLVLDAHNYVIFNSQQIKFSHQTKINFACSGWSGQMSMSSDRGSGFGPTLCGEWSQADTDCAQYLNNVGVGSRWEGSLNLGNESTNVLSPSCPPNSGTCSCDGANADPSSYSSVYKQWLKMNAEAQMHSFEIGWGWFYWTWLTESAVQWSWKLGMNAGILPDKVWDREFNCTMNVPGFDGLPETY